MILFRTSNHKRRHSLAFLKTQGQQTALLARLEKQNWIEEIFHRSLPIPVHYPSRFGPVGFSRNVFYASEKRDTTFFEYGYSLLRYSSVVGLGVNAVCFDLQFIGKQKPIDASQSTNLKQILDLKDYSSAHAWLLSLTSIPESVRYPSGREPAGGGINFAIFEQGAIATSTANIEDFSIYSTREWNSSYPRPYFG